MNGTSFTTNRDQFMAESGLRSPLVTGCVLSPRKGVVPVVLHFGAHCGAVSLRPLGAAPSRKSARPKRSSQREGAALLRP